MNLPLPNLHTLRSPYFATPEQRKMDIHQGIYDTMIVTSVGTPVIEKSACNQLESLGVLDCVHEATSTSGVLEAIKTCAPRILVLDFNFYDPATRMFSFGHRDGTKVLLTLGSLMDVLATLPTLHVVYLNVMGTLEVGATLHTLPSRPLVVCWGPDGCVYHVRARMLVDFMHALSLGIPVLNSFRTAHTEALAAAAASTSASRVGVHVSLVTDFDPRLVTSLPGVRHLVAPPTMARTYLNVTKRRSVFLGAFYSDSAPASHAA